ncbi:MAG: alcohol dehydrogenase catalytic domain-containing protein [Actinomycetota bacterium]
MKAAFFYGPGIFRVEEVKKPKISQDYEVLVKVKACAICGTDVRIFNNGHRLINPPQVIGHEISGIVEDTGGKVKNLKKGDKVVLTVEVGCGHCRFCHKGNVNLCRERKSIGYFYPGGFGQYVLIPEEAVLQGNVIKLRDDASLDEFSLVEPLANCINAQEKIDITFGNTVLIIGAGPIGIMHLELARLRGAGKIIVTDILKKRIDMSRIFKADYYLVSEKGNLKKDVDIITKGRGADVVIVACSCPDAQNMALDLAGIGGKICYFGGLPEGVLLNNFNSNLLHYKEITLLGSFAGTRYHAHAAIDLIENKKIEVSNYITHKFSLDDILEGFRAVAGGQTIKAIVNP